MDSNNKDFHEKMIAAYEKQQRTGASENLYDGSYNRYHIQAKLDPTLFRKLRRYCTENNYSINTALKILIATHPILSQSTNA